MEYITVCQGWGLNGQMHKWTNVPCQLGLVAHRLTLTGQRMNIC